MRDDFRWGQSSNFLFMRQRHWHSFRFLIHSGTHTFNFSIFLVSLREEGGKIQYSNGSETYAILFIGAFYQIIAI